MPLRIIAIPLIALAPSFFTAPAAVAAGDADAGKRIAQQWCSACHVTGKEKRGKGSDAAPSFVGLAQKPVKTEAYLKAWIANPHPPMPNFNLSRRDIDDLVAYIRGLRRNSKTQR
jgi:mono/diheme cytochrome c family protein